jgi:hypothetical protein
MVSDQNTAKSSSAEPSRAEQTRAENRSITNAQSGTQHSSTEQTRESLPCSTTSEFAPSLLVPFVIVAFLLQHTRAP